MSLVAELGLDGLEAAVLLQVDLVVGVDHDLRDVHVAEEGLDRAVAQDVVADLLGDLHPVGVADRAVLAREDVAQHLPDAALEVGLVDVGGVEVRAELLDQLGVHDTLQLVEPLLLRAASAAPRRRVGDLRGLTAAALGGLAAAVGIREAAYPLGCPGSFGAAASGPLPLAPGPAVPAASGPGALSPWAACSA